ncbi:DUF559 domain-containing protein [Phyllobacterium sp. SYP-B3895]|uniref:endonuclease domain-containing protein n=1 Tax=Phyllobacterium sp. SYP-B3895 TaxID=2663240 RepID=UPI001299F038|nr:endonuclease domain-containing protein [Phyllobacterium sp. SYP-B3895]MRG55841.1 DUF559 domain-containing protein [Phyllobacterium sp. SYP-B3895]
MPSHTPIPVKIRQYAKSMRRAQTEPESKLWNCLRAYRLMGLSFKRQVPIAGYIVDFACAAARIIVELDGSHHGEDHSQQYDGARTERLNRDGWTVLRFWNDDVLQDIDGVCQHIVSTVSAGSPVHEP